MKPVHGSPTNAQRVSVEPVTVDDWEILVSGKVHLWHRESFEGTSLLKMLFILYNALFPVLCTLIACFSLWSSKVSNVSERALEAVSSAYIFIQRERGSIIYMY